LKGVNFSPFEEQVIDKMPKGKKLWDFNVDVTASRKKNGSVVYYLLNFEPDLGNPVGMDQVTYDTMLHIVGMIKEENERIESKHRNAVSNKAVDVGALKAVEILEDEADLEADLED
jgi:hypothetical protein